MLRLGGRMCGWSTLLTVLLAGLAAASSDLFDNQLGDINYCKKQCQLTIKNKSPAKVSYDILQKAPFFRWQLHPTFKSLKQYHRGKSMFKWGRKKNVD